MSATTTREQRRAKKSEVKSGPKAEGFTAPAALAKKRPLAGLFFVVLILTGGTITYTSLQASGNELVMVAKGDIARGSVITADNLTTISVSKDSTAGAVLSKDVSSVVGKNATVDLPQGSLLLQSNISSGLEVKAGTSVVGVALTAAQLPSRTLKAGDKVRIIRTPTQGAVETSAPSPIQGTVDAVKFDNIKAISVVDVVVAETDAQNVVAWSAAGSAGLILDPLSPGERK